MTVCPVCGRAMERLVNMMVTQCDHCSFSFSELEACTLRAFNPQDAADRKYRYLLAQGFSHDDWRDL